MPCFTCPHCQKEITVNVKKKPEKKEKKLPQEEKKMERNEFIEWCKKSNKRSLDIIAEWVEVQKIDFATVAQWQVYIQRNIADAVKLSVFTEKHLQVAFLGVENDLKRGMEYTPALSTLLKKITK